MNIFQESSKVEEFLRDKQLQLPAFEQCSENTQRLRNRLLKFYQNDPFSPDADFVVFGSIARNESVGDSDVDWTLLIDGQANPAHANYANEIRRKIDEGPFKKPGTAGTFGNTTISHDLVHYIGGELDTNKNITRRMLLLLESERINFRQNESEDGNAYDRVIKLILQQYFDHDSGLTRKHKETIPRFLLNDMIRFWRTMCVDFAYKQKEQQGQKWGLRNIKLRMSRKLIFVKGLLMCFSQYKKDHIREDFIDSMGNKVAMHPFELFIDLKEHFEIDDDDIVKLLKSYNVFLADMNNNDTRKKLEEMDMEQVDSDNSFKTLRDNCDDFKGTLDSIFLKKSSKLKDLTLKYGFF
jgi:hypothetical protein